MCVCVCVCVRAYVTDTLNRDHLLNPSSGSASVGVSVRVCPLVDIELIQLSVAPEIYHQEMQDAVV